MALAPPPTDGIGDTARALAHESRQRLLALLRERDGGMDASELAVGVDLHVNTVRSHLAVLEDAGLVTRATEARTAPGRPRVLFSPTDPPIDGAAHSGYRLMAEMLASHLVASAADPAAAAEEVGRRWGQHLTPAPRPFTTPDAADARATLVDLLDRVGFAPEAVADPVPARSDGAITLELRRCPFAEVAREYPEVACSLHLGLMRGALERTGGGVTVTDLLHPAPGRCTARLAPLPHPADPHDTTPETIP
ncbi:helix-turn-helix transcriptional regulator [Euzebya sp.]|uniref:helix-turn-helix transcriptional regulator n=1 Tax=Euzebya sp. TaxID=1971409 RepID=UPI00351973EB